MPITDPQAIVFSDEQVRPMAEKVRNLKAEIDAFSLTWFGGVNSLFPNDGTVLEDGRTEEGVSVLTGANVNNLVTQVLSLKTSLDQGGVAAVISLPCVRPLHVVP